MRFRSFFLLTLSFGWLVSPTGHAGIDPCRAAEPRDAVDEQAEEKIVAIYKTDAEWKKLLTRKQFDVTRRHETEAAYSGRLWNNHRAGTYQCVCCEFELFTSETKFDSQTGWPSFWQLAKPKHVKLTPDFSDPAEARVEVLCARCSAHLGHVFDDGPPPTGLRYCMNSAALNFTEAALPPAPPRQPAPARGRGTGQPD